MRSDYRANLCRFVNSTHRVPLHTVGMSVNTETAWSRIQAAMRARGMKATQATAARIVGVSQPSVSDWAKGSIPRMSHAVRLANRLGVCVEWLLTGRGPKVPGGLDARSPASMLSAQALAAAVQYDKLPPAAQRHIDETLARFSGLLKMSSEEILEQALTESAALPELKSVLSEHE